MAFAVTKPRPNKRDPLVDRLLGPGKAFEIEEVIIAGSPQQVFKGADRELSVIFKRAAGLGSHPMVVNHGEQLSYGEVFARIATLTQALHDRYGVTRGTRVALVSANRLEWIIGLVAIIASGGVAALVNSRGAGEEMLRAINNTGCTVAIIDADCARLITAEQADPPWPRILIGAEPSSLRTGLDSDFASLSQPTETPFEPLLMDTEDGAVILFTSGTTGYPKGALLSHGALAHAAAVSSFMGTMQDLRYEEEVGQKVPYGRRSMASPAIILAPMFHLTGVLPVVRAISLAATIHVVGKWSADLAFDLMENSGLSRLVFVPTMLWDVLNSPRATPENLSVIRNLAYGGAPLNPEFVADVRQRMPNCLIANTYGQTENAGWACCLSGEPYLANPDACGWACPTIDIKVVQEDGSEAEIGEPGELWVRSASVMTEYVGEPEATAATLVDGWCATGDIGKVDEDGIFTILDRKKNMVISGGENIYCAEVERVLYDHPKVREVIAYGVPDARLGERLVVTVLLQPDAEMTEDDIKAYCRQRLALYKTPRAVFITHGQFPRTASGKIDRPAFFRAAKAI